MRKIYLEAGVNGIALMVTHFLVLIIGQRFLQFSGKGAERFGISLPHRPSILFVPQKNQDGIAGGAFNQGTQGRT